MIIRTCSVSVMAFELSKPTGFGTSMWVINARFRIC